jgi:hypothetical protein
MALPVDGQRVVVLFLRRSPADNLSMESLSKNWNIVIELIQFLNDRMRSRM